MVDIHTHILPQVDDGSKSFEDSIKMINDSLAQGIKHIILTPHVLSPYTKYKFKDEIIPIYEKFKEKVNKLNIDVNLYLGHEVSYHSQLFEFFKNGKLLTLNNSKMILFELPYETKLSNLDDIIYNFECYDHYLILAHIERYDYYKIKDLKEIKNSQVYFQINASSLSKKSKHYKKAYKLLQLGLVDFISSDIHSNRVNSMMDAFGFVREKFGREYAQKIFYDNPRKII